MSEFKFNLLQLSCAILWLAMTNAAAWHAIELRAMPAYVFIGAFVITAPVWASVGLLAYQLNALKQDEYRQHLLRSQMLWASTMAISFSSFMGFYQAYDSEPGNSSNVATITAWFVGFLIRGLSSTARL